MTAEGEAIDECAEAPARKAAGSVHVYTGQTRSIAAAPSSNTSAAPAELKP